MNSPIVLIYTTWPDEATAKNILTPLLEKNHAACINISPNMKSIYRWQGAIETSNEVIALIKTTEEQVPKIEEHITNHHPYDCPCILTLPVQSTNSPFEKWCRNQIS